MSFVIHKYKVCTAERLLETGFESIVFSTISDFEILSVGIQEDTIVIWIKESHPISIYHQSEVASQDNIKRTEILVYPTGAHVYDDSNKFIGTVINKEGFVFHIFQGRTR